MEHLNYSGFIHNKYYRWYCEIISRASSRIYDSRIHENHHALPRCFGGTVVVPLTFKEHYICHELLTRFTEGVDKMKMCFSLHTFFHFTAHREGIPKTGILYDRHKRLFRESCKQRTPWTKSEVHKFKHRLTQEIFIGTRSEFRNHTGITPQGVNHLLINRDKRFHVNNWGIYSDTIGSYTCDIPRKSQPPQRKVECEHCGKQMIKMNYKKFHGPNCKFHSLENYEVAISQVKNLRKRS